MKPEISDEVKLYLIDQLLCVYYETDTGGHRASAEYARGIIDSIDVIATGGVA